MVREDLAEEMNRDPNDREVEQVATRRHTFQAEGTTTESEVRVNWYV